MNHLFTEFLINQYDEDDVSEEDQAKIYWRMAQGSAAQVSHVP